MNQTVIFGGESNKWSSYDFQGGKITSICGGMELDLTDCYISKENQVIELTVICGSVSLFVSKDWNVLIEVAPVLGVVEDEIMEMNVYTDPAATLVIKGTLVMGSLEIRRV